MSRVSRISSSRLLDASNFFKTFRAGKTGFKTPLYQNTYWLSPRNPYQKEQAEKILKLIMNHSLKDLKYTSQMDPMNLCQYMASSVQNLLFKKDYDRYKIIVNMTIIQKINQAIFMALEHLWDSKKDRHSIYVFEAPTFYAIGTVSAIYYE